uniref:Uncharacterized protein n=1 Tax=Gallus gallus TaxID=9031 RepID=A0A8V0YIZ0_CHICK
SSVENVFTALLIHLQGTHLCKSYVICEEFSHCCMLKTTVFHKIPHELSLQGHMRALNHGKRLFLMLTFDADTCSRVLITTNASFLFPLWLSFCFTCILARDSSFLPLIFFLIALSGKPIISNLFVHCR